MILTLIIMKNHNYLVKNERHNLSTQHHIPSRQPAQTNETVLVL